ncbi:MAG: DUF1800 domain-containing protein [Betaproteobacteria bacterium]
MTDATIVELENQQTASRAPPLAVLGLSGTTLLAACGGGGGTSTTAAITPDNSLANNLALTDAARFLRQASWGGTSNEIKDLAASGQQGWLNAQFNAPQGQSLTRWLIEKGFNDASVSSNVNGDGGWVQSIWWKLFSATDLFRQRAALALSELFVVSHLGLPFSWRNFAIANYWEILEANALGNFRTLLENVTLSSAMGTYLNMKGNQKYDAKTGRSPDENYAREVMQLFTIGLYQLNIDGTLQLDAQGKPIESYDNADIQGLARVFTGWNTATGTDATGELANAAYRHGLPMMLTASLHSPEEKKFLGVTIPAGTSGIESLRIALDTLFQHNNTAPFIAKQLIQRLVTSNPSPAYVARVAKLFVNNGKGVRGDMKAVWTAILMDTEARLANPPASFGKLSEPMIRLLQWGHTFRATSTDGAWTLGYTDAETALGQMPMRSPSVFNFFRPGYVPPNTQAAAQNLVAPEFQILTEPTVVGYINYMAGTVNNARNIKADYTTEKALATDPTALVAHLNLCLASGALTSTSQSLIVNAITSISAATETGLLNRIYAAVLMVMSSTDYLIQR